MADGDPAANAPTRRAGSLVSLVLSLEGDGRRQRLSGDPSRRANVGGRRAPDAPIRPSRSARSRLFRPACPGNGTGTRRRKGHFNVARETPGTIGARRGRRGGEARGSVRCRPPPPPVRSVLAPSAPARSARGRRDPPVAPGFHRARAATNAREASSKAGPRSGGELEAETRPGRPPGPSATHPSCASRSLGALVFPPSSRGPIGACRCVQCGAGGAAAGGGWTASRSPWSPRWRAALAKWFKAGFCAKNASCRVRAGVESSRTPGCLRQDSCAITNANAPPRARRARGSHRAYYFNLCADTYGVRVAAVGTGVPRYGLTNASDEQRRRPEPSGFPWSPRSWSCTTMMSSVSPWVFASCWRTACG